MSSRAGRKKRSQEQQQDVIFAAESMSVDVVEAADGSPGTPSVNITAYTGGKLALTNFPHPVVINLDGVKAMDSDQLPFLRDHAQDRVVGHGTPEVQEKQLRHDGKLSIAGEERDKLTAASKEGFRWQASVGGRIPNIRKDVQTIAAGSRVKVNGRTFVGPINVINAFLWKETSFCASGADEGRASASIAAAQTRRITPMNEFEKWLEASGVNSEELTEAQVTNLKAAYEATLEVDPEPVPAGGLDLSKVVEAATKAALEATQTQSQRDRRVDRLFASYADTSLTAEKVSELRAQVEGGEISEEKAQLELVLASRGNGFTSNVNAGGGGSSMGENYGLELEAALGRNSGLTEEQIHDNLVEAGASKDQAENAVSRSAAKPKGLKSLIMAVCRQAGHHCDEVDDDAIRAAMRFSEQNQGRDIAATSGFSSVSLPGILSRLANKAMLAAYAEADNGGVATTIASTTSTNDFKKFTRYRMTEAGVMTVVPPSGEIQHTTLTEETYENKVETFGKMIALTRQMIRNDDLDAFTQIPRMIGRMGRHALEQATITTLVDAPTAVGAGTTEFFHGAARGNDQLNYLEGAATDLSLDALEPAYEAFLNQLDSDGKPIMIDPAMLLVTNENIIMARKLFTDTQYRFTVDAIRETIGNQWEGFFNPVKSAYLSRLGAVPSSTQWYLLSNPTTDVSGLQIAFLDGNQTPIIQSSETSFNTLGMEMRGYFDFGVALQDPRAIVKVKGAV